MKKVITMVLMLLTWSSGARADHPAVHGMLLFGKQKTYASHLPMFHAPHDYQVILKLVLSDISGASTVQIYNEAKKTTSDYFTLVPEPMDLTQIMTGQKKTFEAAIFKGHFERGGQNLGSVQVQVEKVIYSKKLDPDIPPSLEDGYLVFGASGEYFAAHLIQGKPNFDAILEVSPPFSLSEPVCTRRFCPDATPVKVSDAQLPVTLSSPTSGALPKVGESLGQLPGQLVNVQKIHYVELNELAH